MFYESNFFQRFDACVPLSFVKAYVAPMYLQVEVLKSL